MFERPGEPASDEHMGGDPTRGGRVIALPGPEERHLSSAQRGPLAEELMAVSSECEAPPGGAAGDRWRAPMDRDVELIERTLRGDAAASGELVTRLLPVIKKRIAAMCLVVRADVEDVAQQTLIELLVRERSALRSWNPSRGPLETFVFGVARNAASRLRRAQNRNPVRGAVPTEGHTLDQYPCQCSSPESAAERQELKRRVVDALKERFPEEYDLLSRVGVQQRAALSQELGLTRNALDKRFSRLKAIIRSLVDEVSGGTSDD